MPSPPFFSSRHGLDWEGGLFSNMCAMRLKYRWGKSCCPSVAGTQLVYDGRASGAAYNSPGQGGGEILCLPLNTSGQYYIFYSTWRRI